jgi:uncharacterized protein with PIN domain
MSQEESSLMYEISQIASNVSKWQSENRKPTLNEITDIVEAELDDLRKVFIEKLISGSQQEEAIDCPNCENRMMKNGQRSRKLKEIGGKEIELKREQMRCQQCQTTFFPPR